MNNGPSLLRLQPRTVAALIFRRWAVSEDVSKVDRFMGTTPEDGLTIEQRG